MHRLHLGVLVDHLSALGRRGAAVVGALTLLAGPWR
jgi:hypothetical protein